MTPEKNYTIKEIIYETNDYFFALPFSLFHFLFYISSPLTGEDKR
jgi:hypothetical protein